MPLAVQTQLIEQADKMKIARSFCSLTVLVSLGLYTSVSLADEPTKETTLATLQEKPAALFNGKNLDGWKISKEIDFEDHGKVTVENGAITLGEGKPATGIVCQTKLPRMDYEISLEAKRVEGSDFFCGLTFPVNKEYCTLIVGGWGGGVTGLSNIDGMSAVENETTGFSEFDNNKWYRIRLRVTEKEIKAWIGKHSILTVDPTDRKFSIWWEQEPMRPLGIASWNTKSALRNIKLTQLNEEREKPKKEK